METLSDTERMLCERVEAGEAARVHNREVIRAEVIRRIALDLPVARDPASLLRRPGATTVPTPAGIRLIGALIEGRLDLSDAGSGDATACALEFRDCIFNGGFSGAHGHFARLSFEDCRFRDAPPASPATASPKADEADAEAAIPPSIDLTGAVVQGELNARNVRADRRGDHMFISAAEVRIAGSVNLSRSHLKALPWRKSVSVDRQNSVALCLNLARIEGDITCLRGFVAQGSLAMRSAQVGGDVWLSGSRIGFTEQEIAEHEDLESLFMQSAEIAGHLMLDGRPDNRDQTGLFRPFVAMGDINLLGLKTGGDLRLDDFELNGSLTLAGAVIKGAITIVAQRVPNARISKQVFGASLTCGGDLTLGVEVGSFVDLANCCIAGSLNLSELRLTGENKFANPDLNLEAGTIAKSLTLQLGGQREPKLLKARTKQLESLPGFTLAETLWRLDPVDKPSKLAQIGFLLKKDAGVRLDGQSATLHRAVARNGHAIDDIVKAEEYLRLFCTYLQADASSRTAFPIISDPEMLPPRVRIDQEAIRENLERVAGGDFKGEEDATAADLERASLYQSVTDIPVETFAFRAIEAPEGRSGYFFEACVLYDRALFRAKFGLSAQPRQVLIEMIESRHTGIYLADVPIFTGALTYPASNSAEGEADRRAGDAPWPTFVTCPTLSGMADADAETMLALDDRVASQVQTNIVLRGKVKLDALKCDALRDYGGSSWGDGVAISMNHFVYATTEWNLPALRAGKGPRAWVKSLLLDYAPGPIYWWMDLRARLARNVGQSSESNAQRFSGLRRSPWQVRRDWLYQQFQLPGQAALNLARVEIAQEQYQPQPFEQIIKVSRAEGHEEYATRFEIDKKNIEWRLATRRLRPAFLVGGAVAAGAWILLDSGPEVSKALILTLVVAAAVYALTRLVKVIGNFFRPGMLNPVAGLSPSQLHGHSGHFGRLMRLAQVNKLLAANPANEALLREKQELEAAIRTFANDPSQHRVVRRVMWISLGESLKDPPGIATVLLVSLAVWLIVGPTGELARLLVSAGLLFLAIVYLSDIVNLVMRWCFGYLRRPFRALATLTAVLLAGWWGVATANEARMLVVDVAPVAPLVRDDDGRIIIGGELVPLTPDAGVANNVHCGGTISEPLYALDVLIPLIDLRQEIKCEVGQAQLPKAAPEPPASGMESLEYSPTFWSVAKAFYAILGWIVTSLVILTFVHVFRARTDSG